ncbi:MAG: GldG family protein [Oscillospiraceae bacterium]|jgi:ABC-type uncharacterized transport system involved in gliding motility auxiliary subunit|nr:GldG family protein [Oscillospiraceae bacterium]
MNIGKINIGREGAAIAFVAVAVAAFVLLNVLAGMLTERFYLKADITSFDLYTVTDVTADTLRDLPFGITFSFLLSENSAMTQARELTEFMRKYESLSGGLVKLQFLDINLNPGLREQYGLTSNVAMGDVLVTGEGGAKRTRHIPIADMFDSAASGFLGERMLTNAILNVTAEYLPSVAIIRGHGEETDGLDELRTLYTDAGFQVYEINLITEEIPADTEILVIAAPSAEYSAPEIEMIDTFLNGSKGSLIYLTHNERSESLRRYFNEWGIRLEDSFVLDSLFNWGGQREQVVPLPTQHEMFASLPRNTYGIAFLPRVLSLTEKPSVTAETLIASSSSSYARAFDSDNKTVAQDDDDAVGPFDLAVMSTVSTFSNETYTYEYATVVVMPLYMMDSLFLPAGGYLNRDIAASLISYLSPAAKTVNIPARTLEDTPLSLFGIPGIVIIGLLVVALPLTIIVGGLVVWLRRRRA